jgi:hypothetical protein
MEWRYAGCSIERFAGKVWPKYISSDDDPLYRFHQWQANLRVLEVTEIKTVPYVRLSHPFVERLIGTVQRVFLAMTKFWVRQTIGKLAIIGHQDQPFTLEIERPTGYR